MQALIDQQKSYEVALVISGKEDAMGLQRGKDQGIPSFFVGKDNYPEATLRINTMLTLLQDYNIDYIALAGYLSIVPTEIIQAYPNKIINIHPSLIPSFCGMGFHGQHVHQAVYDTGTKITGATVHFVNEEVDGGAIILQEAVAVESKDTPEIIGRKVLKLEHRIFPKAMNYLAEDRIKVENKRTFIQE